MKSIQAQDARNIPIWDAKPNSWVDQYTPSRLKPFFRLSRLDRPVGSWLLFLPSALSVEIAVFNNPRAITHVFLVLLVLAVGSVLMRGAGCTWNDIVDRHIDAKVTRTQSRPLPSGQISVTSAYIWMFAQMLVALGFLLLLSPKAIIVAIASLGIVAIYPFAKRFTNWPQVILGFAFNWGVWVAMVELGGNFYATLLLYIALIFWTLFYDTIYAFQDIEDDMLIGVKSSAQAISNFAKKGLLVFWICASIFLLASVIVVQITSSLTSSSLVYFLYLGGAFFGVTLYAIWDVFDPKLADRNLALFRFNAKAGQILAVTWLLPVIWEGTLRFVLA